MQRKNWIITGSIAVLLAVSLLAISSPSLYSGGKTSCSKKKLEKSTLKSIYRGEMLQDNLSSQFFLIPRGI